MQPQPPLHNLGKASVFLMVAVAVTALLIGVMWQSRSAFEAQQPPEFERLILLPTPRAISPVTLLNHRREAVDLETFKGRWSLLFFGFTHCPDICPTTLLALKTARAQLEQQGRWPKLEIAMVTVDPERDTSERLAQYVPFFHPEFTGITGDEADITEFAKEVGILFVKTAEQASGYYEVDHSVSLILINPQGQFAGVLTAPHEAPVLAADLARFYDYLEDQGLHKPVESLDSATSQTVPPAHEAVQVEHAWVRTAPANAWATSGYFSVTNSTDSPLTILSASSPLFERIEMHQTLIDEQGLASMEALETAVVAPNDTLKFKPMGRHLMLIGAKRQIQEGDLIPIVLKTERGDLDAIAYVGSGPAS